MLQARVRPAAGGSVCADVLCFAVLLALQAISDTKLKISDASRIESIMSDAATALELLDADGEAGDAEMLHEASTSLHSLETALDAWELERLLDMPYASSGAILTITAGAGGTDAQARPCALL